MRAFIIHTRHPKSMQYARQALASFEQHCGWEPRLFEGYTPSSMPACRMRRPSRAATLPQPMRNFKQACSLNHRRFFRMCVDLDEPIAIIEHDSQCIADWTEPEWDDVLVLNIRSALEWSWTRRHNFQPPPHGIHDIDYDTYRHDPKINGARIMVGLAAYAVTPRGAAKMLRAYDEGWEQGDFIINTAYVRIQALMPELFTFHSKNLRTSHGAHAL